MPFSAVQIDAWKLQNCQWSEPYKHKLSEDDIAMLSEGKSSDADSETLSAPSDTLKKKEL